MGPAVTSVHVIGVSVGAFAADACARTCTAIRAKGTHRPRVSLTLLDPFTARGVLGWGYGRRWFGTTVDYASQFLNSDDPVPSTNAPLPHCFVYDVTPAKASFRLPKPYFGHAWPIDFWSRRFTLPAPGARGPPWRRLSNMPLHDMKRPRGGVHAISNTWETAC